MKEFQIAFSSFQILWAKQGGIGKNNLAKYATGTAAFPIIIVDLDDCEKFYKEITAESLKWEITITTLLSELRHAVQESLGK
jgi:hypothetical protein